MAENNINTEEIMAEIQDRIRERGYTDLDLKFDDVSAGGYDKYEKPEYSHDELSNEIYYADSSKGVDYLQPMDGSGLKLAIKKVIRKLCKPAVAPMVESQNLFNGATARAETRELLRALDAKNRGLYRRLLGAMERAGIDGWHEKISSGNL